MDNMFAHDPNVRPGGVTFIALLTYFSGLISIVVSVLGLLGFSSPTIQQRHANPPAAIAVLIIQGLLGVAYVVVAGGLWRLRRWAFWTAIAISVLLVVNNVFELWQHYLASPVTVGGLVLPIFVLLYFGLSRSARKAFGV
ncbi:MAG: hypothetical protein ACXVCX_21775 [Ktedonobacterales bacterium]